MTTSEAENTTEEPREAPMGTSTTEDSPEEPEAPEQEPDDDNRLSKVRAEAQGLRGRLRDTEAERDGLAERVAAFQRAEVVRLATGKDQMADGSDLFRAGVDQATLLGDDGSVDPERVQAAVTDVLTARPHWRHRTSPKADHSQGGGSPADDGGPSWSDVLESGRK